ncbi:unnamed protein product [Blepharisma stoltei]|uniref:ERCC4 domain-containing protein n=1 Tax=Blepharisma stoltei TaxID=1481888 RepID=A0AAU9J4F3_9CILI|nr:unnamed protein product [Blepharisma stoltei]
MATLRFHTIISNDLQKYKNALLCLGTGLGSLEVISVFLRSNLDADAKNLWILLNFSQQEISTLTSLFEVVDIGSEKIDSRSREITYKKGGAVHVTGRTAVTDILEEKIDPNKVKGIVIHNVDKLGSACNEMFIVNLLLEKNPEISVKLVTENPFWVNLNDIKEFGISKVLCWPKSRYEIAEELENFAGNWQKITLQPSGAALKIHNLLIDMLQVCINEIKRSNKNFDLQEIDLQSAVLKKHYQILKSTMDFKLRNLPSKTKTLCDNIEQVRKMLKKLEHCDSLEFLEYLLRFMKFIREQVSDYRASEGIWHNMENETEELIKVARDRVIKIDENNVNFNLSPSKKWETLGKMVKNTIETEESGSILIINPYSVHQAYLKQYIVAYLKGTPEVILEFKLKCLLESFNPLLTYESKNQLIQEQLSNMLNELKSKYEVSFSLHPSESFPTPVFNKELDESDLILQEYVLDSFGYSWNDFQVPNWDIKILNRHQIDNFMNINPTHIFICSYDLSLIRKIEIYAAICRDLEFPLKNVVLFAAPLYENLLYSFSQQAEIAGFKHLLTCEIPRVISLRENAAKIIVDKREFSSILPYELYKQGIRVIPAQLQVGDYILSPSICVERKSVTTDDIFQSLSSGRLHDQLIKMKSYYDRCVLLIEFREDTEFSLSATNSRSIACLHLSQLLNKIPGISLLWSTSPEQSARFFLKIKQNQPDPILSEALHKGCSSSDALSMLPSIPGISSENIHIILQNFASISKIAQSSQSDLEKLIDPKSAGLIFSFFNSQTVSHRLN